MLWNMTIKCQRYSSLIFSIGQKIFYYIYISETKEETKAYFDFSIRGHIFSIENQEHAMRDENKFSLCLVSNHVLTEDLTGLLYVYFLYNKSRQHSTLPRHHR
jgi:hypothetical protein